MIREGTDAQVAAQRKQQELARYQAQKQKEGVTAGYYAGLGALNEAAANNGYSSLGGQSRSEQANAVSQMTQAQNNIENTLQTNIAQIESNIANLVQQGRLAEAEQQFNNLQFLKQEEQRVLDNQYRNDAFEWQKQNDLFNRAIAEGNLTGVYNGLPTLAKQQLVESIRQFDKTFDENVRQFGLNNALQEAQLKLQQQQLALSASRSGGSGINGMTPEKILSYAQWFIDNGREIPYDLELAIGGLFGGDSSNGSGSTYSASGQSSWKPASVTSFASGMDMGPAYQAIMGAKNSPTSGNSLSDLEWNIIKDMPSTIGRE